MGLLRPARPQGPARVHRHRAGGVDGASATSGDPVVEEVDGGRRWTFPPTPPLSTYNPVVVAGPFLEMRTRGRRLRPGSATPARSLAPVLERDAERAVHAHRAGTRVLRRPLQRCRSPSASYDQVFLPEFGGAMENYGCVTWTDDVPAPPRADHRPSGEWFVKVLLHEMAHMWFGNIVTMRWWDDLWLNEAFAEFACNWAAERATAYTDAWREQPRRTSKLDAYLADQGPSSHPIRQPDRRRSPRPTSIFDSITYPKGAAVLNQLMYLRRRGDVQRGHERLLRRARLGQHHPARTSSARWARPSGRDLRAVAHGVARDRRRRPARASSRTADGLVLTAVGAHGAPHPQVLGVGAYRRAGDGPRARSAPSSSRSTASARRVEGLPAARPLPGERRRD